MDGRHRRRDIAHHHPQVRKNGSDWMWTCDCGATSSLYVRTRRPWRRAVVEALRHSTEIAA
jgi:hypothetical protein